MSVGKKIGDLIKLQGKTQKEVAEKAGITPQSLNNYISRDSARIDLQAFFKICDALNIDVSYFREDGIKDFYKEHPNAAPIDEYKGNTNNEKELLALFRKLDDRQQIKFIGKAEEIVKEMLADSSDDEYSKQEGVG